MTSSKSVPSPSLFIIIISRFNSKTEMPVPSKATLEGSFCDLKRKNTDEDITIAVMFYRIMAGLLKRYHFSREAMLGLLARFKARPGRIGGDETSSELKLKGILGANVDVSGLEQD